MMQRKHGMHSNKAGPAGYQDTYSRFRRCHSSHCTAKAPGGDHETSRE
jgi:hypothetical protein